MMKSFLLLVCGLIATASAYTSTGVCPDFETKQDFQVDPYLGKWFEIQRYYAVFQEGMDCTKAQYTLLDDGSIEVYNSARESDGNFTDITGNAVVKGPGSLAVTFNDGAPGSYEVLGTDYESYSSVYSCTQLGPAMVQYAWVLSRTATMDDALKAEAESWFTMYNIDLSIFDTTYQGPDCPYPS